MSLLQRLAAVGLGRREGEAEADAAAAARRAAATIERLPPHAAEPGSGLGIRQAADRAPAPAGTRPPRPAEPPVQKPVDDDQLDIPAFLRRQAN